MDLFSSTSSCLLSSAHTHAHTRLLRDVFAPLPASRRLAYVDVADEIADAVRRAPSAVRNRDALPNDPLLQDLLLSMLAADPAQRCVWVCVGGC